MSDRFAERLHSHFASLRVPERPVFAAAPLRKRGWLAPVAAAAAVLLLLGVAGLRPWEGRGLVVADSGPRPSIPDELARYTFATATVTKSPPGQAIALYQHGSNGDAADLPQVLIVGAFRDWYRQVDAAYERADPDDQSAPAPCLLSPDGRTVAVGSHLGLGNLILVDLESGRRQSLQAQERSAIRPLAWSSNGRYIAAMKLPDVATNQVPTGPIVIFDLRPAAGESAYRETTASGAMVAFSPDGREMAIEGSDSFDITDLTGLTLRTLDVGEGRLATPAAWSPDGRWVGLTYSADAARPLSREIRFIDPSGAGAAGPATVPDASSMLGWTGSDRVVVQFEQFIREVNLETRRETAFTRTDSWPENHFRVSQIQLAAGLTTDLEVRHGTWLPDRGPWPDEYRYAGLAAAAIVILLTIVIVCRRQRRRRG